MTNIITNYIPMQVKYLQLYPTYYITVKATYMLTIITKYSLNLQRNTILIHRHRFPVSLFISASV